MVFVRSCDCFVAELTPRSAHMLYVNTIYGTFHCIKLTYFQGMVQIGLYVPALNGKQSAHNMGVFCCALASANPVPSKEIENAVKAFTTGCVAR